MGRTGKDEFAIFISGAITKDGIREKAELLKHSLEKIIETDRPEKQEIYIGICMAAGTGINFDEMYGTACGALENVQSSEEDKAQIHIGEIHTDNEKAQGEYNTCLLYTSRCV